VRARNAGCWMYGSITDLAPLKVMLDIEERSETYFHVEHTDVPNFFKVGDRVVTFGMYGNVTGVAPLKVMLDKDETSKKHYCVEHTDVPFFKVGDRVFARDSTNCWNGIYGYGNVIDVAPVKVLLDCQHHWSPQFNQFPYVEPTRVPFFKVGDRVRVKVESYFFRRLGAWKYGNVTDAAPVRVMLDQDSRPYWGLRPSSFCVVEPTNVPFFKVGDRVRARNSAREDWRYGEVTDTFPLMVRLYTTDRSYWWRLVEHISEDSLTDGAAAQNAASKGLKVKQPPRLEHRTGAGRDTADQICGQGV